MALWIFGYGSLVWRPAFPHRRRQPGYVEGWARRFWQASTDHRGVPGAPGRVVTLVPAAERCWGMAYEVDEADRDRVLATLDHREKGGYTRHEAAITLPREERQVRTLFYLATEDNENYLGPAPLAAIAFQVARSRGPSGTNREYVLRLAEALREMGAEDAHVFGLAALLDNRRPS